MKAYNEQWIYNREISRHAGRWHERGLLTDGQMAMVQQGYPVGFRQTNGILEIGLFLFTTVAVLGTFLLVITVVSELFENRVSFGLFSILFGVGVGLLGWQLINRRLLYRNGIDNAFAVLTTGFLTFGLLLFLPENLTVASYCLMALPLLLLGLWYYGDTILAFLAVGTLYAFVFDGLLLFGWGKAALPFVMMVVSVGLYGLSRSRRLFWGSTGGPAMGETYYADPLNLTETLSLVVLIASGNYYVVRELNALLLNPTPPVAPEIALPALFWLLTFLIPVLYVWRGVATRNRILLSLGGLGLVAAVATVHAYAGLVPLNVALTLGGLLLIGVAVAGIRYLRIGKQGFTDIPDDDSTDGFFVNAQTLAAMQAAAGTQPNPKDGVRFGGGNFSGGGSEGQY